MTDAFRSVCAESGKKYAIETRSALLTSYKRLQLTRFEPLTIEAELHGLGDASSDCARDALRAARRATSHILCRSEG
jgi:hypothetical protein